jgi:hypothetical protein
MGFCINCGTPVPEMAQFCTNCGTKTSTATVAQNQPGGLDALYYVAYATGQTGGPFTEEAVRNLITQQQVKVTDSIRPNTSDAWMPMVRSKFAPLVAQQANLDRLAVSTCPRCAAGMVVVIKRSKAGLVLVILGLALTPLFGLGIPIFIVGFIMRWGGKGQAAYRCPNCNYAT